MEPRKITGQTVDMADGSPLVDVDTSVLLLLDELRSRPRMHAALAQLINTAAIGQAPWHVYEDAIADGVEREVQYVNGTTRVIVLRPIEGESDAEPPA